MRRHDFNLDLIRAIAVLSVLSVHFFLNSGFYDTPVVGPAMVCGVILRTFLMLCVPLFLLLTGYLKGHHTWSLSYYRGLGKILLGYLLASLACLAFRTFYYKEALTPYLWIQKIFDFTGANYAWYIEMYLGLFFLIPFLNVLWKHLDSNLARDALLLTVVGLSIFPSIDTLSQGAIGIQALTPWWEKLYPLAYYLTGRRLRERPPRWNRGLCLLGSILSAVAGGLLHSYQMYGEPLAYSPMTYWNGIFPYLTVVLFFLALRKRGPSRAPAPVRWCVSKVAAMSLPIFLLSWIADQLVYPKLIAAIPDMAHRLPWIVVTVPLVLVCATLMAQVLTWIQNAILSLPRRKRVKVS